MDKFLMDKDGHLTRNPEYEENKDIYVKWKHVKELIDLIHTRDGFMDWTDSYEKYDKKVKNTIQWLERNAKEID